MTARHRRDYRGHMMGEMFTFVLFGVFLLLSLLIVVIGVQNYREVVDTSESVGEVRTSLGYVAGKVRSNAANDGMALEHLDGVDVLVLTEVIRDRPYSTLIYHMDGALYELYTSGDGSDFSVDDGDPLIDIAGFEMDCSQEGLLCLTATTDDGRAQVLHLAMRPQEGS